MSSKRSYAGEEDLAESRKKIGRFSTDSRRNSVFLVHPVESFSGNFPFYREPKEIGCFSQNHVRKFVHDSSQLRYIIHPKDPGHVKFDLRHGYRNRIARDEFAKDYINDLLRWVQLNFHKFQVGDNQTADHRLHTDFICWRGLFTKLVCTPFENRDGWIIAVTKYRGTHYMCEFDTEERVRQKMTESERQKEMSYWGFKFEQYMTAVQPDGKPDPTPPVNNNEAYCSVVRGRLGKHSMVFGGETDGCEIDSRNSKRYIELKTSREITHPNQERNFKKFKLIKWWAQSFLVGIPKIICGFRDDDGIVNYLKTYRTMEIPKLVQDIPGAWDPALCFNFCDQVLQFIKDTVTQDDPRVVYVFRWSPRQPITWTVEKNPSEYSFLPDWYIDQ